MTIQACPTVHKPITNPRRLLPLNRVRVPEDFYNLVITRTAAPVTGWSPCEADETRYYKETSFDVPF